MKMTLTFALLLQKLLEGDHVNYGDFQGSSRKLVDRFIDDAVLEYTVIGTQRKKLCCRDVQNVRDYLHHKFQTPSLEQYIEFLQAEDFTRSDAVKATADSKYRKVNVMEGFLVNTYEEIQTRLAGNEVTIRPVNGSFLFIHDIQHFDIPPSVTVVGVENYENFRGVDRQRYLFQGLQPLFVWRYQNSNAIAKWLMRIPNRYLHFGDYDLKGLHIYVSEFRNKIGASRCSFFVPENLEALMSTYGDAALYNKQIDYMQNVDFDAVPEIAEVVRVIRKYRKGLAQEVLIEG